MPGSSDSSGPEAAYDAGPFVPDGAGLDALRRAAGACEGCPLHRDATQTVFGAGDASARVVLLGEQPGDQEDRQGKPFVGPAGKLLARALGEAGIDPDETYVTNAVKHFKFVLQEQRGKRRIHKSPSLREMGACRPWLDAELRVVDPEVIVTLGGTAGKALFGSSFKVTQSRGTLLDHEEGRVLPTIHPSAVLRAGNDREAAYGGLVDDLKVAAGALR